MKGNWNRAATVESFEQDPVGEATLMGASLRPKRSAWQDIRRGWGFQKWFPLDIRDRPWRVRTPGALLGETSGKVSSGVNRQGRGKRRRRNRAGEANLRIVNTRRCKRWRGSQLHERSSKCEDATLGGGPRRRTGRNFRLRGRGEVQGGSMSDSAKGPRSDPRENDKGQTER